VQVEVEINGRIRHVDVARRGDRFVVSLDGNAWQVDAARIDPQTLSLLMSRGDRAGLKDDIVESHEVTVSPDAVSGRFVIRVATTPVLAGTNGRRARRSEDSVAATGPQRVSAPMPGKIVRVLVKLGDVVRARQPLVVVEAMKMENELRADRAGTVAEVRVQEGQSVDAGALLVVIQ